MRLNFYTLDERLEYKEICMKFMVYGIYKFIRTRFSCNFIKKGCFWGWRAMNATEIQAVNKLRTADTYWEPVAAFLLDRYRRLVGKIIATSNQIEDVVSDLMLTVVQIVCSIRTHEEFVQLLHPPFQAILLRHVSRSSVAATFADELIFLFNQALVKVS